MHRNVSLFKEIPRIYIHSLKKLLFVNKIMQKDHINIAMRILQKEFLNKIDGLCHECCALAYSAVYAFLT